MRSRWCDVDVKMRLHVLLWCYIISIFIIILKMKMMLYLFLCALLLTLIRPRWRYYVLWCSSPWKVQDATKKFFLRSVKPGSRYYVILPDVMWCHVICSACSVWKRRWCHVMSCDVMWFYVMLIYVMSCYVLWCRAAPLRMNRLLICGKPSHQMEDWRGPSLNRKNIYFIFSNFAQFIFFEQGHFAHKWELIVNTISDINYTYHGWQRM